MKTIFNKFSFTAVAVAASMTLGSCADFLETTPYDFTQPQTFYQNETDCKMALAGIYWTISREDVYGNRYSCMLSNIDDLSYYRRPVSAITNQVYGNDHNPSNSDIWKTWQALYAGINNANLLLENIDRVQMNEKTKKNIKGEAKFLRAYYHFLLAQAWYDVPVRKQSLQDINMTPMEATPHKEAIQWVIDEMEACVDMVDDEDYDKSPSHVKKNTFMGILARVYLWQAGKYGEGGTESYKMAAHWAGKVVESDKHILNPSYEELFKLMAQDKYDATYNESIWEAEFIGNREADGLNNYTEGRIGNVIGLEQPKADNPIGFGYGFYGATYILWDLYAENDKRRDLAISEEYYKKDRNEPYKWEYSDKKTQVVQRTCGKYRRTWEVSNGRSKTYTPQNYPILRYADVLLMWSEGLLESGASIEDALKGINLVRKRAGIDELQKETMDKEKLRKEIRDERARELCFESLRKYDLVRWGIYYKAIHDDLGARTSNKGSKPGQWPTGNNFVSADTYTKNTQEKHQFLPIPALELDVNTKLEQNKFWE